MALTSNNFINGWSTGPNDVVGIEYDVAFLGVNPNIGLYGFRTIGPKFAFTCALNSNHLSYVAAVDSDANRANCEILTTMAAYRTPTGQQARGGVVARASGAAGSENGYFCWIGVATDYDLGPGLYIGKFVGGVFTRLAFKAFFQWPNTFANAEDWYVRFRVNGTSIKAKAWRFDATEPLTWDVSNTDTSIAGAGHIGFACMSTTANALGFNLPGFIAVGTNGETAPRPISDVEQRRWLNEDSNRRVMLAEIGVLGSDAFGNGVPSVALVSNAPYVTQGAEVPSAQVYDDVMVQVPSFTSKAPTDLIGASSQSYGDAIIKNEDGVRDDWLRWNWDGRSFDLYMGGENWRRWDFIKVLSGTVYEVYAPKKDQIGLRIRDRSALLNRKIQTTTIGGTGPNAGLPQPITFGRVFNIEPVLKEASTLTYKYHDESIAGATGIVQVRSNGATPVSITDLGNGEFQLVSGANANAQITMDVNIDVSAGSTTRAGNRHSLLLQTLIENRAGFGPGSTYQGTRSGSLVNFGADPTDEIGLYLKEETNFMDAIDQVAGSAGGFWYFNRLGLFCASLVRVPAAPYDWDLLEDDVSDFRIEKISLPSVAQQLGYQKNYTQQDPSSLAGSVSVANRAQFSAQAQYTVVVPAYSGLDNPGNHQLRQLPRNRDTLLWSQADANAEVTRLDAVASKTCALVSFDTHLNSIYYNLGDSLNLTYPRYGFDNGQAGIIVGLDEDFEAATIRITLYVQLAGKFPSTTAGSPYVTVADFY